MSNMEKIISWITENEVWLTVIISFASLIATIVLTVLIIRQTKKLNEKQSKMEETINEQQIILQKRQLSVDTFPYKREIYSYVYSIFEMCEAINTTVKNERLYDYDYDQVNDYFSIIKDQYVPNMRKTIWCLRESEYILPDDISGTVLRIMNEFNEMCFCFQSLKVIKKLATEQELDEIKKQHIDDGLRMCKEILKFVSFIESIMPTELDIATVNR